MYDRSIPTQQKHSAIKAISPKNKVLILGSLYLAQGLPYGFFTQALPALMRKEGLSLQWIGLSSLLALPWALKFLWAPYVDRYSLPKWGRRKSWILPLQWLACVLFVGIAFQDISSGWVIILSAFLCANLLAATQDIATDGLAIELLDHSERGWGNGLQVAGYRVGMILGGGALLILFHYTNWFWTSLAMAALLAWTSWPITLFKEPESTVQSTVEKTIEHTKQAPEAPLHATWGAFVRRPHIVGWLIAIALYKSGDALATGMLRPFLIDLGMDLAELGWLLGTAGFLAGLLGALVGGWGVQKLGRRRALLYFGAFQALTVTLYILPTLGYHDTFFLYIICTLEHFAGGMATAALFTLMMDICSPSQAATDYTLQASLVVFSKGSLTALSGYSAAHLGFTAHFALAGGMCVIGLFAIYWATQPLSAYFKGGS